VAGRIVRWTIRFSGTQSRRRTSKGVGSVDPADRDAGHLGSSAIVEDVLFNKGTVGALRIGSVVVDMSSIKPSEAKHHTELLAARGVVYVDAPVSGGTVGAEQGTLAIMVGGTVGADDFATIEPILRAMGRPTHVGPVGAGQFAKLANQIIVGVTIGAVAEALLLASTGGADPAKVIEALRGGFAESKVLDVHGQRMIERDFVTKGRSKTHLKDLDNALDAARSIGMCATPYSALSADMFRALLDNAGDLDHSGLLVELERRNQRNNQTS
jgi:3-hydroxyisobutyrate dehydrogenase-like beta-hydroxyacid dehydrogenase